MNEEFVVECINKAKKGESKCDNKVLALDGMSGTMTRHLYNNLCSFRHTNDKTTAYLEIGCFKGSSTISSLYQNDCVATVIDNWSEFGGPKDAFHTNMKHFLKDKFSDDYIQVLNEDSFNLHTEPKFKPYDIYLYDGNHQVQSQEKAITDFWKYLADPCLIIVDDWNWTCAKEGTNKGLEKVNANVLKHWDISEPTGGKGFWNGCGLFLVSKTK